MSSGTIVDENRETALTVIPKNELAVVAKKAEAKANKFGKVGTGFAFGALSEFGMFIGGLAAVHLAPVVAPILGIAGLVSLFGGGITTLVFQEAEAKARRRQRDAIAERSSRLNKMARTALQGAIADDTIRIGLDLCIEPKDETPKKVHVEDMNATVGAKGGKKLKISAQIFEERGASIDWLSISASVVSLEQSVTAFPKSMVASIRSEVPPGGAESAIEPQPIAPALEKKLPSYTPSLGS